jgi:hypothetical protein
LLISLTSTRYYVWSTAPTAKPLTLISIGQFRQKLREIRRKFRGLAGADPDEPYYKQIGLVVGPFPSYSDTRPRYLGRSTSKLQYDKLAVRVPASSYQPLGVSEAEENTADTDATAEMRSKACAELNRIYNDAMSCIKGKQGKGGKLDNPAYLQKTNIAKQTVGPILNVSQSYLGLHHECLTKGEAHHPLVSTPAAYMPF